MGILAAARASGSSSQRIHHHHLACSLLSQSIQRGSSKHHARRPPQRWLVASTSSSAQASSSSQGPSSSPSSQSSTAFPPSVKTALLAATCLAVGFGAGQAFQSQQEQHDHHHHRNPQVLPNGLPRTCCDKESNDDTNSQILTPEQYELPNKLAKIVGRAHILDGRIQDSDTLPFLKGARMGQGTALCIIRPQKLQHVIDAVQLIVDADCVIVPQGQNTGLTGGSVPNNNDNNNTDTRPTVVISFKDLNRHFLLDDGRRVVCLAGTGLATLADFVQAEFPHRESHSILGSTFLNPTTAAGVAFGSGGTQVRKGPAYTDRALYLTIDETPWGKRQVHVVNTLGIKGLEDSDFEHIGGPLRKMDSVASRLDTWSRWVQGGYERRMKYSTPEGTKLAAHDVWYGHRLCDDQADPERISRYNADTRGSLPNRSEGKVIILATVHDTFPRPQETKTFWVSFDSLETAAAFRKEVCLDNPQDLPCSLEYMDRDAFDVIDAAGRILANTIWLFGTTSPIVQQLWNLKLWIQGLPVAGSDKWVDFLLYTFNAICPPGLPSPVMRLAKQYDHHAALTVGDFGHGEMDRFMERLEEFQKTRSIQIHECATESEANSLSAFRFAAAPAFRTYCVGKGLSGFSVDYALPQNKDDQVPPLSNADTSVAQPVKRMRYSHFGCNVVHEDLAYPVETDILQAKYAFKHAVEHESKGRLPAEHGHGREYSAPPETKERWKHMDPLNVLNPGIGGLSSAYRYGETKS